MNPGPRLKKPILILFIGLFLFLAYLALAFVLQKVDPTTKLTSVNTSNSIQKTTAQPTFVGNWDTGCLIPDPNSPWAEKHIIEISSTGTGKHQRYSGESCSTLKADEADNFNWTSPSSGTINISYTSGIAADNTIYDIFKVSDDTLLFGHGFCNCTSLDNKFGANENDRFTQLNKFLLYKKQPPKI